MSAKGEKNSNERLNWVLRSSGNGETKKGWTRCWVGYLKIWPWRMGLWVEERPISEEDRRGIPKKGTAGEKARKPLTYYKGDLARVERRDVTHREVFNIWREGSRQPWRVFQSDLRKINMTSLPVLEVEERETDATPGSCSLSWTKQCFSNGKQRRDIMELK